MLHHKIMVDITHVSSSSYPIYLGENIYHDLRFLQQHVAGSQVMIVTHPRLADSYLEPLQCAFINQGILCDTVIIPEGEQYKQVETWMRIIDALVAHKHHRDTTLIALGGGVVGDITGFAAATYQRGVSFIQMPTSLLAQVDASIGGKTGINHSQGKNLIGAFYQPASVIVDIAFLKTLTMRELQAGCAEILKAALIADADFFVWLEKNYKNILRLEPKACLYAIQRACIIKKNHVCQDEKEKGRRALLNLGHTFGHALEHVMGYGSWLHGEAVAVGMVLAARLSERYRGFPRQQTQRLEQVLCEMGLPVRIPQEISPEDLMCAMSLDKKIEKNKMRFVLLSSIGSAVISDQVAWIDVEEVLKNGYSR